MRKGLAINIALLFKGCKCDVFYNTMYFKGSYNWVDGWSTLYTHWGRGQPVKRTNGGCVAIVNGHWRDAPCNIQRGFVCKKSYGKLF